MNTTTDKLGARALRLGSMDVVCLASLVILAVVVRVAFFRGISSLDELNYLRHAAELWKDRFDLGGVLYLHGTRPLVFTPVSWSFAAFGVSEASALLWPFLLSVATVPLVYLGARTLFGRECAIYAGIFACVLPLFVNEATRLLPGSIMNFFIALSVLCFIVSENSARRRRPWLFLSGAAFAATPLAVELGLTLGAFFAAAILLWKRHSPWSYWPLALGFLAVLGAETLRYIVVTGDAMFKMQVSRQTFSIDVPPFLPFYYAGALIKPFAAHGGILYLSGVGALAGIAARRRETWPLTVWFVATWLFIEYASSTLTEYRPLYKSVRYLSGVSVAGVLLAGAGMARIREILWAMPGVGRPILRRPALALALVLIISSSIAALHRQGAETAPSRAGFLAVREHVRAARGRTIYVTHWMWNTSVGFFLEFDDRYFPSGYHPFHAVLLDRADASSKNRYVQTLAPGEKMDDGILLNDERLLELSRGERQVGSVGPGEIPGVLGRADDLWRRMDRITVDAHSVVALYEIPAGAHWPGEAGR